MSNELKIFGGTANTALTNEICEYLDCELGKSSVTRFSDGEIYFQILENVRGADVFIVQPTCPPVDSNFFELFLMIDAFKRASAKRITAVLPYFGYARQDRKDKPRVPISSKVVSDLLVASGTDRLLTMDLHAPQIQGFFSIPVDHLFAAPVLVEHFQKLNLPNLTVVSPDAGGVERARAFAKRLNAELAMVNKRRIEANVAQVMNVIGDVKGRTCLVVDDIIDTAGTLVKNGGSAAERRRNKGLCVLHASGAFRAGGRTDPEFGSGGSRRDQHHSAAQRCEEVQENFGAQRGQAAGAGRPVDPRRDIGERFIYLERGGSYG